MGNVVPLCTNRSESRLRRLRELPRSCATIQQATPYPGFPMDAARAPTLSIQDFAANLVCLKDRFRADRMEEKRKHPRTEIEEIAYVSSGGSVMRCVVRNISAEGAAIDVENPAFVPQRFRLVMAKDSSIVHECRVAWIKQNRIGLTFIIDAADEPQRTSNADCRTTRSSASHRAPPYPIFPFPA